MTKLKILFLFISLLGLRWYLLPSPLPSEWQSESIIRYKTTILNQIEHNDTKTIIRSGKWIIKLDGFKEIDVGSRVSFVGSVVPKWKMGKIIQIEMNNPEYEVMGKQNNLFNKIIIGLGKSREKWVTTIERVLPEPMASLASGILLGVKREIPQDFYNELVKTGTMHIVAASGYNVSIVAATLMQVLLLAVSRGWAIVGGIVGIVAYVLISGVSASVVRAGIMGSLTLISFYFGKPSEAKRLLFVTGFIMLLIDPLLVVDIGFELSFAATAGILYLEPIFREYGIKSKFLAEYLWPTLAASIATLPIILWYFGRVSWISPIVNLLVLPVVPLIMGLTALLLGVATVYLPIGEIIAWIVYVPLAYMIYVIQIFGR